MFNKGETYHEFQIFNMGYSSSSMKTPEDGAKLSKLFKIGMEICLPLEGNYSSGVFTRNCTACFQFVKDE